MKKGVKSPVFLIQKEIPKTKPKKTAFDIFGCRQISKRSAKGKNFKEKKNGTLIGKKVKKKKSGTIMAKDEKKKKKGENLRKIRAFMVPFFLSLTFIPLALLFEIWR